MYQTIKLILLTLGPLMNIDLVAMDARMVVYLDHFQNYEHNKDLNESKQCFVKNGDVQSLNDIEHDLLKLISASKYIDLLFDINKINAFLMNQQDVEDTKNVFTRNEFLEFLTKNPNLLKQLSNENKKEFTEIIKFLAMNAKTKDSFFKEYISPYLSKNIPKNKKIQAVFKSSRENIFLLNIDDQLKNLYAEELIEENTSDSSLITLIKFMTDNKPIKNLLRLLLKNQKINQLFLATMKIRVQDYMKAICSSASAQKNPDIWVHEYFEYKGFNDKKITEVRSLVSEFKLSKNCLENMHKIRSSNESGHLCPKGSQKLDMNDTIKHLEHIQCELDD